MTNLAPPKSRNSNTSVSAGQFYFTLGRAITLNNIFIISGDRAPRRSNCIAGNFLAITE